MTDKYISSFHIQKLGHELLEIRQRALFTIVSKLENGFIFDSEIARTRELLTQLFKWFLYEPCTNEDIVLRLIKMTLQSDAGMVLINHCGKNIIKSELEKIRTYIKPMYLNSLNDVIEILNTSGSPNVEVPPLQSCIPLSYRSNYSENTQLLPNSTATTIKGLVQQQSSVDHQIGYIEDSETSEKNTFGIGDEINDSNYTLPWQPLIETDTHVLQSVEKSLSKPSQPISLFHSCEFFINVLLHDFPAEVFIQRPKIVLNFHDLMYTINSMKVINIVLECLHNLTKALQVRINHCNDPSMRNLKTEHILNFNSNSNLSLAGKESSRSSATESCAVHEDILVLKNNQLTLPDYCFRTIKLILKCMVFQQETLEDSRPKFGKKGTSLSVMLLDELFNLLYLCVPKGVWKNQQQSENITILKDLNDVSTYYGDVLEYYRIESISLENDYTKRVMYLHLLITCTKFLKKLIPLQRTKLIFPKNFRISITNSLLDVSLGRLFPKVHRCLLEYVESFSDENDFNYLKKYKAVINICEGLKATVRFLKHHETLTFTESLHLTRSALLSLEFHRNLTFLAHFIDICSEKFYSFRDDVITSVAEEIILQLLAHPLEMIQNEVYKLCHKKVLDNIGTKVNINNTGNSGAAVYFLLSSKILIEITQFGLKNENVKFLAEEILIYIVKCRHIVNDVIWNCCVEALISTLPYLLCFADNNSILGQNIINLADPDTAKALQLPDIVMFKANVQLLFAKDSYLREEAFSRICWLMASQENSREFLPTLNTVFDKALANACQIKKVIDINKIRTSGHFYQPSSLNQVMNLLKSPNIEPVIRRSALNQVSVIIEDPLLHDVFLESQGLDLVVGMMKTSLTEKDYRDYPDSIIPIISILKSLCLYHSSVREELSANENVLNFTLRGLFLFFTDEKMRQDASALLFLLIFKDCLVGSPSRDDFSVPVLVNEKTLMPFVGRTHGDTSDYVPESFYDTITKDRWCLSSLQIQWNAELNSGFEKLLQIRDLNPSGKEIIKTEAILQLNKCDLQLIKTSCVHHCIEKLLYTIQNATSHTGVIESIIELTMYINLYKKSMQFSNETDMILSHHWESTFTRFIRTLPSSKDDVYLLKSVIRFLLLLVPFYKQSGQNWITSFLKNPSHTLLDLLYADNLPDEDLKELSQDLLRLVSLCASQEHHYLDYYNLEVVTRTSQNWNHIIKTIAENLRFCDSQHFYNLAYLDSLLCCLVNLTAILGWSNSKDSQKPNKYLPQLISSLCELIKSFHCGKGQTAAISVMGMNISKSVLLTLNNLLAELQYLKVKRWEDCFFEDFDNTYFISLLTLWASRDVILRAAALQLFAGLANSSKIASKIRNDLNYENNSVWELAFTIVIDHTEAGIVRENAALLLVNLTNHMYVSVLNGNPASLGMSSEDTSKKNITTELINLIAEYDFYGQLEIILTSLFTLKSSVGSDNKFDYFHNSDYSNSPDQNFEQINITTPGFVKAVCMFLHNLVNFASDDIIGELYEKGLVKLLFRTICDPTVAVDRTRELVLYCDLLDLNIKVCLLLRKLCNNSPLCLGSVLHTKDCLNVMLSLLNPKTYHTHLPQLIYLRNKLWSEIFNLLVILLASCNDDSKLKFSTDALTIINETLMDIGISSFLETLFESLLCIGASELQNASLFVLVSFFKVECQTYSNDSVSHNLAKHSLSTIFDTMQTPRTVIMSSCKENVENRDPNCGKLIKKQNKSKGQKTNLLEGLYFNNIIQTTKADPVDNFEVSFVENETTALMSGGELCKILLYLYDITNIKIPTETGFAEKRPLILAALTGLLYISQEAKKFALQNSLMEILVKQLRDYHIKLSLESVEALKRVQDKKRLCPILKEIHDIVGLLTNFMIKNVNAKNLATQLNLPDIIHKLWIWFSFQNTYIVDVLRMLQIYTTECGEACRSLPLTSAVAGSGPRKVAGNLSLLHVIINLIAKEMNQISKTHDLICLEMAFNILHNCLETLECRVLISKSNLLNSMSRLNPSKSKHQPTWENVEFIWMEFLQMFSKYPEGQSIIAKSREWLEIILACCSGSSRSTNREMALRIIRNISFYQPNKPRLLSSGEFLSVLQSRLMIGTTEEKRTTIVIIWSLAANNQKAKLIFKSANLDSKLENVVKHWHLLYDNNDLDQNDLQRAYSILTMLRGNS